MTRGLMRNEIGCHPNEAAKIRNLMMAKLDKICPQNSKNKINQK